MKEYKLVTAVNEADLVKLVSKWLTVNWELQGGVSVSHNAVGKQRPTFMYAQAMVRSKGKVG